MLGLGAEAKASHDGSTRRRRLASPMHCTDDHGAARPHSHLRSAPPASYQLQKKKKLGASAARRAHVVPRPQRQRGAPPQSSALATNGSDRGGPEHEGAAGVWVPPLPLPPDGTTAVPAPPPRLPPAGTTAAPSHRLPKAATLPPHLDTLKPNGHAARHSRGAHTSSGGGAWRRRRSGAGARRPAWHSLPPAGSCTKLYTRRAAGRHVERGRAC